MSQRAKLTFEIVYREWRATVHSYVHLDDRGAFALARDYTHQQLKRAAPKSQVVYVGAVWS